MVKIYRILLMAQVMTAGAVMVTFRLIESRLVAGFVAGSFFVLLGLVILAAGLRGLIPKRSPTFALGCVHLFAVALPMMVTRLMNLGVDFREVHVWGIPGPIFHQMSTQLYVVMMGVTAGEGLWRRYRARS